MSLSDNDFCQLLKRVRSGDSEAATELVREYESEIRRVIRLRLTDPSIRRVIDSMDICQSVLVNFFVRVTQGEFDLDKPAELVKLLTVMVRNKVIDQSRRLKAGKRFGGLAPGSSPSQLNEIPDREPGVSTLVANRDLIEAIKQRLDPFDRHLAESRAAGMGWPELSAELGVSGDALRKRLSRALDQALQDLEGNGHRDVR